MAWKPIGWEAGRLGGLTAGEPVWEHGEEKLLVISFSLLV